jgi:hypothetical protein
MGFCSCFTNETSSLRSSAPLRIPSAYSVGEGVLFSG